MSSENITPITKEQKIIHLEIKTLDEKGVFEGYGSVFNNKDTYGDVILPGAFTDYLAKNTEPGSIKLLWQHNTAEPIGVYLEILENKKGLYVKGQLLINDVARAKEAYALMKAGAIDGLSIGFTINSEGSYYNKDGSTRYLTSLKLWEISIVTFPANQRAVISNIKEHNVDDNTIRDFENYLRDSGRFSNSEAVAIASLASEIATHPYIKTLQRDVEDKTTPDTLSQDVLKIISALREGAKNL